MLKILSDPQRIWALNHRAQRRPGRYARIRNGRTAGKWSDCQYRDDRDRGAASTDEKAKGTQHNRGAGDEQRKMPDTTGIFLEPGRLRISSAERD